MRQQDDYVPFVDMDADEIGNLFVDVQTLVNGISEYIAGLS
jgi:hypothetical protein